MNKQVIGNLISDMRVERTDARARRNSRLIVAAVIMAIMLSMVVIFFPPLADVNASNVLDDPTLADNMKPEAQ